LEGVRAVSSWAYDFELIAKRRQSAMVWLVTPDSKQAKASRPHDTLCLQAKVQELEAKFMRQIHVCASIT
jgi:hypothetical protein